MAVQLEFVTLDYEQGFAALQDLEAVLLLLLDYLPVWAEFAYQLIRLLIINTRLIYLRGISHLNSIISCQPLSIKFINFITYVFIY